ncbi:MAG: glycoside hydrolase family 2 protein [Oscillospiraceae bacterium]|nr:glycoside hydrolase family 2 protein [Oscillospiraceae bacterium]
MRHIININEGWAFTKDTCPIPDTFPADWEKVNLPHSWNAIDGQDGGADYHRGTCHYARRLSRADLPEAERYYLEINGANSSADVILNGKNLAHHDGGYSTWRVDITDTLQEENLLVIDVDNAPNDTVYPQMADFTFYGGLYRDVNIIAVPESHFNLDYYGGPGIRVTPIMEGADAKTTVHVYLDNRKPSQRIRYTMKNAEGKVISTHETADSKVVFRIVGAHLWNGRKDPYLYSVTAELVENGEVIDAISTRFGCRSFEIDPDRGFILNGKEYPLRGVSRHQDRWGIGNALLPCHHDEDMDLICEVGATTIRLAHYQHDQYFYDLCDERGLVIWAEIPYISNHMPGGRENTISQMRELVTQNYNHPSIVVWGLSNEISMKGPKDPDLLKNHHILNDMVHAMDHTRLTTMAVVSMCDMDADYVHIPDTVSYNHYFGWYGGDTSMNGPWFDKFHTKYPEKPIGCSEYGCEALNWHTSDPRQGDYTEEYQAYYHEELIRQLFTRKYLWATHVWNMFDFGADARGEGGENGQNHKGLVTFDRKYKKDAFYAYKAWLSDSPFVHICGKRYVDRVEDVTRVTVYSNLPSVELLANGESLGVKEASDHFFYFDVPNVGETTLVAIAGECRDESVLRKVDTFNEEYRLKESGAVLNWFDITEKEGYFSLNDKLSDIMATVGGKVWMGTLLMTLKKKMDANKSGKEKTDKPSIDLNMGTIKSMMAMMGSFTVLRLSSMVGMANVTFSKEDLLKMNAQLNKIKKPRK